MQKEKEKELCNMVVEIPKDTTAKMEVAIDVPLTPIQQDRLKDGRLRYYDSPIPWNYGMFPRTWENPVHPHFIDNQVLYGDGDPLDVVEISGVSLPTGSVVPVKPLGIFAMIDEGCLDWKVIAIQQGNALFGKLNDVADVERELPGELDRIREWFRSYKMSTGKPLNQFAFDERALDKTKAYDVIIETYLAYQKRVDAHLQNETESV